MFKNLLQRRSSALDYDSLRATVSYMHDDAVRTAGCERLAIALGQVLREIDACQRREMTPPAGEVIAARFVPFRRPNP